MSFAIVPVKTSQPEAIAGELKTVFASDREGPMAGMVQFMPNKRLGAINFNPLQYAENVAGSALVGCASSAASGGSCASGAAAAAVSAGLAPVTNSVFQNAQYDIG